MAKKPLRIKGKDWEKDRRCRLNQTFDGLAKLLPNCEETSAPLTKMQILQRAILLIKDLQFKIKEMLKGNNMPVLQSQFELEEGLKSLIHRNILLMQFLNKAGIKVPPFCAPKVFSFIVTPTLKNALDDAEPNLIAPEIVKPVDNTINKSKNNKQKTAKNYKVLLNKPTSLGDNEITGNVPSSHLPVDKIISSKPMETNEINCTITETSVTTGLSVSVTNTTTTTTSVKSSSKDTRNISNLQNIPPIPQLTSNPITTYTTITTAPLLTTGIVLPTTNLISFSPIMGSNISVTNLSSTKKPFLLPKIQKTKVVTVGNSKNVSKSGKIAIPALPNKIVFKKTKRTRRKKCEIVKERNLLKLSGITVDQCNKNKKLEAKNSEIINNQCNQNKISESINMQLVHEQEHLDQLQLIEQDLNLLQENQQEKQKENQDQQHQSQEKLQDVQQHPQEQQQQNNQQDLVPEQKRDQQQQVQQKQQQHELEQQQKLQLDKQKQLAEQQQKDQSQHQWTIQELKQKTEEHKEHESQLQHVNEKQQEQKQKQYEVQQDLQQKVQQDLQQSENQEKQQTSLENPQQHLQLQHQPNQDPQEQQIKLRQEQQNDKTQMHSQNQHQLSTLTDSHSQQICQYEQIVKQLQHHITQENIKTQAQQQHESELGQQNQLIRENHENKHQHQKQHGKQDEKVDEKNKEQKMKQKKQPDIQNKPQDDKQQPQQDQTLHQQQRQQQLRVQQKQSHSLQHNLKSLDNNQDTITESALNFPSNMLLSNDILESSQLESLSPTAAYLSTFPVVSTSGGGARLTDNDDMLLASLLGCKDYENISDEKSTKINQDINNQLIDSQCISVDFKLKPINHNNKLSISSNNTMSTETLTTITSSISKYTTEQSSYKYSPASTDCRIRAILDNSYNQYGSNNVDNNIQRNESINDTQDMSVIHSKKKYVINKFGKDFEPIFTFSVATSTNTVLTNTKSLSSLCIAASLPSVPPPPPLPVLTNCLSTNQFDLSKSLAKSLAPPSSQLMSSISSLSNINNSKSTSFNYMTSSDTSFTFTLSKITTTVTTSTYNNNQPNVCPENQKLSHFYKDNFNCIDEKFPLCTVTSSFSINNSITDSNSHHRFIFTPSTYNQSQVYAETQKSSQYFKDNSSCINEKLPSSSCPINNSITDPYSHQYQQQHQQDHFQNYNQQSQQQQHHQQQQFNPFAYDNNPNYHMTSDPFSFTLSNTVSTPTKVSAVMNPYSSSADTVSTSSTLNYFGNFVDHYGIDSNNVSSKNVIETKTQATTKMDKKLFPQKFKISPDGSYPYHTLSKATSKESVKSIHQKQHVNWMTSIDTQNEFPILPPPLPPPPPISLSMQPSIITQSIPSSLTHKTTYTDFMSHPTTNNQLCSVSWSGSMPTSSTVTTSCTITHFSTQYPSNSCSTNQYVQQIEHKTPTTSSSSTSTSTTTSLISLPPINLPPIDRKNDMYFGGHTNFLDDNFPWSPNKMLDVQNIYSTTLPTLHGDLALNTIPMVLPNSSNTVSSIPSNICEGNRKYTNKKMYVDGNFQQNHLIDTNVPSINSDVNNLFSVSHLVDLNTTNKSISSNIVEHQQQQQSTIDSIGKFYNERIKSRDFKKNVASKTIQNYSFNNSSNSKNDIINYSLNNNVTTTQHEPTIKSNNGLSNNYSAEALLSQSTLTKRDKSCYYNSYPATITTNPSNWEYSNNTTNNNSNNNNQIQEYPANIYPNLDYTNDLNFNYYNTNYCFQPTYAEHDYLGAATNSSINSTYPDNYGSVKSSNYHQMRYQPYASCSVNKNPNRTKLSNKQSYSSNNTIATITTSSSTTTTTTITTTTASLTNPKLATVTTTTSTVATKSIINATIAPTSVTTSIYTKKYDYLQNNLCLYESSTSSPATVPLLSNYYSNSLNMNPTITSSSSSSSVVSLPAMPSSKMYPPLQTSTTTADTNFHLNLNNFILPNLPSNSTMTNQTPAVLPTQIPPSLSDMQNFQLYSSYSNSSSHNHNNSNSSNNIKSSNFNVSNICPEINDKVRQQHWSVY